MNFLYALFLLAFRFIVILPVCGDLMVFRYTICYGRFVYRSLKHYLFRLLANSKRWKHVSPVGKLRNAAPLHLWGSIKKPHAGDDNAYRTSMRKKLVTIVN